MSELSLDNARESLTAHLITGGLGYCCEAWFWAHFAAIPADLLAARLGVTERTIQRHRLLLKQGELGCQGKINCLNRKVPHF